METNFHNNVPNKDEEKNKEETWFDDWSFILIEYRFGK